MTPKLWLAAACVAAMLAGTASAAEGPFLADRHAQRGINCTQCHGPAGMGKMMEDADRHEACVACHGWYDKVAAKTQPKDPEEMNPHSQHDGNLPCSTCHKGHKPGENYCAKCHYYTFKVP